MSSFNKTKSITIKHFFSFEGASISEVYKLQRTLKQLMEKGWLLCYAQKQGSSICVYHEDGSLFHTVTNTTEYNKLNKILQNEKLLIGEILYDDKISTDNYLLIKLFYDHISGNHNQKDIVRLWLRDLTAKEHCISVPKANYIGKESKADALEKKSTKIEFPCYEDDNYEYFDFDRINIHNELNDEIISVTDKHQEDLYHNTPFVVLAEQNPALPSIYDMCLPNGTMFSIIGDEESEDLKLRKWISEIGIVPVTVQSYVKVSTNCLFLHFRAFKRKSRCQEVDDFISSQFIEDSIDIELEDGVFEKIVDIIDPNHDQSMTDNLNVGAIIPNWASQAGYFILNENEPIWLAPSYNADVLDQVHQNDGTRGRVISYRNNYDGTYHFELKFHIEK